MKDHITFLCFIRTEAACCVFFYFNIDSISYSHELLAGLTAPVFPIQILKFEDKYIIDQQLIFIARKRLSSLIKYFIIIEHKLTACHRD